jgi:hypothetical protein
MTRIVQRTRRSNNGTDLAIEAVGLEKSFGQGHGFRVSTVGVILMIVGGVGLVVSMIVFGVSRRPAGSRHHTYDRETTDTQGDSTSVHEEVR